MPAAGRAAARRRARGYGGRRVGDGEPKSPTPKMCNTWQSRYDSSAGWSGYGPPLQAARPAQGAWPAVSLISMFP
jgi:hypothetical protein